MTQETDLLQPTDLVIEYNSMLMTFRGVLSIIIIIILIITTDAINSYIALAVLGIWFVISLVWIRKAYKNTVLIITGVGIKIHDKYNIEWKDISSFFIKTVVNEGADDEILVLKTSIRDFDFDLSDLSVDRERLDRWIKFYKIEAE